MGNFKVTIKRKDQSLNREVNKDSFTVGRSIDCDISLNDNHISRVHLVVTRRWNQIWVEDKNSSNGTFINGTRIVQGSPVNVVASDRIQLGKSEYVLTVEVETEVIPEPEPVVSLPEEEEEKLESPALAETVAMPPPQSPFHAERLLHDAKRRAAQIILEGETQAEKRVQAIYQKARDAQSQAELFYQTRISEAHKEADAILADFQNQGRELLQSARNMSQELREEVDLYVQGLREKARADAENVVAEATLESEKMKSEALRQARETAAQETALLLKNAQEEANRVLEFTRLQTQEVQERLQTDSATLEQVQKDVAENEIRLKHAKKDLEEAQNQDMEIRGRLLEYQKTEEEKLKNFIETEEAKLKEHVENERSQVRDYVETERTKIDEYVATEQAKIKKLVETEESSLQERLKVAEEKLQAQIQQEEEQLKSLQTSSAKLQDEKNVLEKHVKALQEKQAQLSMDVRDIESKKDHMFKEFESQKVFLNEKLEKEKSQIMKTEEQRIEEMRLENSKRLQKMEQDLLEDVIRRRTSLVKDMHIAVEKEVVKHMSAAQWRDVSATIEKHMAEALDGKVANISQSSAIQSKPVDLMKKRKQERTQWTFAGVAAGLLIFFVAQTAIQKVNSDSAPMQTLVQREAQKRQEDLEKRRFNPAQTEELKDTYTDAVIYTRNFTDLYADQDFQQKLYKSVSQYLYKTWRIDEDKSIQVLAASRTLVKELQDKKSQIHPDFVKEGLQKMRELELASLERMKEILGTEVRVDSYRRFERNFYKEEMQRRRIANH